MHQGLGSRLADKRSELGLRLIDIAAMSNLTVPTIRLIESGSGTIGSLLKIKISYDLQLSWGRIRFSTNQTGRPANIMSVLQWGNAILLCLFPLFNINYNKWSGLIVHF